jgi:hypothetical protein
MDTVLHDVVLDYISASQLHLEFCAKPAHLFLPFRITVSVDHVQKFLPSEKKTVASVVLTKNYHVWKQSEMSFNVVH